MPKVTARSDGRFCSTIRVSGKKLFIYGATEAEVRAKLRDLQAQKQKGTLRPPTHRTTAEYLTWWLASVKPSLKATTFQSYEELLTLHVIPHVGTTKLEKLTPAQVQGLYAELLNGKRSPRRVQMVHRVLSKALKDATRLDLIGQNPCDRVNAPKVHRLEPVLWTEEELQRFIETQYTKPHRWSSLWLLLLGSGLRIGEALGLAWNAVNQNDATIEVRQTLSYVRRVASLSTPKSTAGKRTVALPSIALDALKTQRVQQAREKLKAGESWKSSDFVFTAPDGSHPTQSALRHCFETACRWAGVPEIRVHDLRHLHATLLAQAGADVKHLQRRMGHSNVTVTLQVYAHASSRGDLVLAETLNRALAVDSLKLKRA